MLSILKIDTEYVHIKRLSLTKSAAKRGYVMTLPNWYIRIMLAQKKCFYSGENFIRDDEDMCLSFERIDNSKGYVIGNVVPVTRKYNNIRGNIETFNDVQNIIIKMQKRKDDVSRLIENASKRLSSSIDHLQKCQGKIDPVQEKGLRNRIKKRKKNIKGLRKDFKEREKRINNMHIIRDGLFECSRRSTICTVLKLVYNSIMN